MELEEMTDFVFVKDIGLAFQKEQRARNKSYGKVIVNGWVNMTN